MGYLPLVPLVGLTGIASGQLYQIRPPFSLSECPLRGLHSSRELLLGVLYPLVSGLSGKVFRKFPSAFLRDPVSV